MAKDRFSFVNTKFTAENKNNNIRIFFFTITKRIRKEKTKENRKIVRNLSFFLNDTIA